MCVSPSPETDRNGSPYSATSFAARFTAATTVTCWPSIARMATSKPSQAPAFAPAILGALHDATSGYVLPFGITACVQLVAATAILAGRSMATSPKTSSLGHVRK